jgi:tRNA A-37 threonylcarbamoyl transferase component Bud32
MGVVYEALDRARGGIVALKTLAEMHPSGLLRFKNEFRSLADIAHPNLVPLYELFAEENLWYFTMEYVEGDDFLGFVAGRPATDALESAETLTVAADAASSASERSYASARVTPAVSDFDRLRNALRQVAEGLMALHENGKLHRDVKPSNILVTPAGRAVILDFGLVSELQDAVKPSKVSGTVFYLSPEQAAKRMLSPASDWYAMGVTLFQALTGRLPFLGSTREVLIAKISRDAPSVLEVNGGVPPDLADLCGRLLQRDPAARPSGVEILRLLSGDSPGTEGKAREAAPVFVGRTGEQAVLDAAFRDARSGRASLVLLSGVSGVGKSALVRHFFDRLDAPGAMRLSGRCYEQESVPYKAVDSAVDRLSNELERLPPAELASVTPRNAWALVRLFPVLARIPAFAGPESAVDAYEQRRLAFGALRELLRRLAARAPLIVHLDDLQWGDADSAALLTELLRQPGAPAFLLIAGFRSGYAAKSAFLQRLIAAASAPGLIRREIELQPFDAADARELAAALLGNAPAETIDAIARESRGNPFFARALSVDAAQGTLKSETASLDEVLWNRAQRLSAEAKAVLETVAVAGGPIEQSCAFRAAGIEGQGLRVLTLLRKEMLVRGSGSMSVEEIDTYHDRVRESVLARLDVERRRDCHRHIAEALESVESADPEALAVHHEAAGNRDRAAFHYVSAADAAARVVAFTRASDLYARALELRAWTAEERHSLEVRRAEALANAGLGLAAARLFEQTASAAPAARRAAFERMAAYHYCASGHVDAGRAAAQRVLDRYGIPLPMSRLGAISTIVAEQIRLRLRGLAYREQSEATADPRKLQAVDAALDIGESLGMVDVYPAFATIARGLRSALDAGEPHRIARAAAIVAAQSGSTFRQAESGAYRPLLDLSAAIVNAAKDDRLSGYHELAHAILAFNHGRYPEELRHTQAAADLFARCPGTAWHLSTVRAFEMYGLFHLARVNELKAKCEAYIGEARNRGDRYLETLAGTMPLPFVLLLRGSPEAAERTANEALAAWVVKADDQPRSATWIALSYLAFYRGDGLAGLIDAAGFSRSVRATGLDQVTNMRVFALQLEGNAHLLGVSRKVAGARLDKVARAVARLDREKQRNADAIAAGLRAGVARLRGEDAEPELRRCLALASSLSMDGLANAARVRLGDAESLGAAERWAAEQGIPDLPSVTRMYLPGFPETS